MAGATIDVTIDDREVRELLERIRKRLGDLTPAMKIIGATVRTSVIRNFEKSGRPKKWKEHSKTTEKRRGKGAKILMAQGLGAGLAGSINYKAGKDRVDIGTPKVYGAVHQFGAKKGSFGTVEAMIREHLRTITQAFGKPIPKKQVKVGAHKRKTILPWGDIPARPFLMVQDEDWTEIRAALTDYLLEGA
jgi:phage virion morphogenesis protein